MDKNSKLKMAVVGVGYLGRFHAQKVKGNPHAELVGVSDRSLQQAEKVAQELGVKCFNDYKELAGHVDAVTVASSTMAHYEIAKYFLSQGVAVNVEKPMTFRIHESEELVNLAREKGVVLSVGHVERFNPVIVEARKHCENPAMIELTRVGPFKERGADVNVLYDLMIHDIDLALWMGGAEIKEVHGIGGCLVSKELDWCEVQITLQNGVQAFIKVSRVSPTSERRLSLYQRDKIVMADTQSLKLELLFQSKVPGEFLKSEVLPFEKFDALQLETNAFIDAVIGKHHPVVSGVDGLNALKAIEWIENKIKKIQY